MYACVLDVGSIRMLYWNICTCIMGYMLYLFWLAQLYVHVCMRLTLFFTITPACFPCISLLVFCRHTQITDMGSAASTKNDVVVEVKSDARGSRDTKPAPKSQVRNTLKLSVNPCNKRIAATLRSWEDLLPFWMFTMIPWYHDHKWKKNEKEMKIKWKKKKT